jgi:hypothetical protein
MPEAIEGFCELLAEMIYERLTSEDGRIASGRDALPIDSVSKRPELESFVQNRYSISVLEATLQVGLLERIAIPQRNRDGRLVTSGAFKFFHDQYTQYCLAAAYQQRILGWLDEACLSDQGRLSVLIGKIADIVRASVAAPILAGALDHWLQKNIANFHGGKIGPVVPLLDGLVDNGSPALRHLAIALVTNLVLRGSLAAPDVYGAIFRMGSPRLRLSLVDSFVSFWPQLTPAALRAFIDSCDPRRDFEVLDRLGDVFALRISTEPEEVAAYLGKAIRPLSFASIAEPLRIRRQSRFALQVTIFSVFSCFDQPKAMLAVRGFVRAKYRAVLDLVDDTQRGSAFGRVARRTVRQLLFKLFDSFGVAQWNKFIAAMEPSGNDRFFVENDGVIQHDLLARFLPFVVDLHNGESDKLSLAEGTAFRDLALRMLDFRPASVIGYNSVIALPSILVKQDFSVTRSLVMELIARRTPSAIFHGQLLLSNLSFSDLRLALPSLELFRDEIIPSLLDAGAQCDWSMSFCVASLDVPRLWPVFDGLLESFFTHFDKLGDRQACAEFGEHLYKVCFCSDLMLGRNVIARMLEDRQRFLGPMWRACTMKVFAAMLARRPTTLIAILATAGGEDDLVREARAYQSAEIVKQSRLFPFQVDVNRFVAWLFVAEPRLRYAIIKHFIGSLATGTSVEDFPPGVRQTMVAVINVFFGDHPDAAPQGKLSVAEIEASVAAARGRRKAA